MKLPLKTVAALWVCILFMLSASAFAHTRLKSSAPKNDQVLEAAPEQLNLFFQGKVRLAKVTLQNSQEEKLDMGFKPIMQPQKDFQIPLPELAADTYQVNWVAMGADGHKMQGYFQFTVTNEKSVDDGNESETESHNHGDGHSMDKPADLPVVTVYTSSCCQIKNHNADNMLAYKQQTKPEASRCSCHINFFNDYALKSYVTAKNIVQTLFKKTDIYSEIKVPATRCFF